MFVHSLHGTCWPPPVTMSTTVTLITEPNAAFLCSISADLMALGLLVFLVQIYITFEGLSLTTISSRVGETSGAGLGPLDK